jgi:hypothetical protein
MIPGKRIVMVVAGDRSAASRTNCKNRDCRSALRNSGELNALIETVLNGDRI